MQTKNNPRNSRAPADGSGIAEFEAKPSAKAPVPLVSAMSSSRPTPKPASGVAKVVEAEDGPDELVVRTTGGTEGEQKMPAEIIAMAFGQRVAVRVVGSLGNRSISSASIMGGGGSKK